MPTPDRTRWAVLCKPGYIHSLSGEILLVCVDQDQAMAEQSVLDLGEPLDCSPHRVEALSNECIG